MEHHTSQSRFRLCCNDWLRPAFAFLIPAFLILAQPGFSSQLWFLLSSLVPHFQGVPISRSLIFFYQPSPTKTHDSTSALWNNREQKPTFSPRGQTFIICIPITDLFNYFSCDAIHRPLVPLAALLPVLLSEAGNMRQGGLTQWENSGIADTLILSNWAPDQDHSRFVW